MKYLFVAAILAGSTVSYAAAPAMMVYKAIPTGGCCEEWVKHVNQAGFPTKVINSTDVTSVKTPTWRACLIQFLPHRRARK
ncbi:hypothetical protein ACTMU2_35450 (plasmid) [Cupriavidus basilensis]